MKTYEIPAENLAKLELKINALARRAVKLDLPEPELEIVGERMVEIKDSVGMTGSYRKVFDVSVTGESPQIEGFTLIAIIEHLPDGNIINKLPSHRDVEIPDYYRFIDPVCQHCQLHRERKHLYVIQDSAGKLMTVGSDCLKDFTGHKNPDALAKWYTVLEDTLTEAEREDWDGGGPTNYPSGGKVMAGAAWLDPFSPKKVLGLCKQWATARAALIELFPYGKDGGDRPEIFSGLIHDGNRAENMARISTSEDQEHSLRVRWGDELRWFVRIAEYVLEKEAKQ